LHLNIQEENGGKRLWSCLKAKETFMKSFNSLFLLFALSLALFSCNDEDPGPRQNDDRSFAVVDFDRLEISEALDVTVQQGSSFSIQARGDSRNINDLEVYKNGNTLQIKFDNYRNRQYTTYITITMPVIRGLDFSGAVNGRINGFTEPISRFDLSLSGASMGQLDVNANEIYALLTGASNLRIHGTGKKIEASVSGASQFTAFDYPVEMARLTVTGASHAKINAAAQLYVSASGASEVLYRGTPFVEADVAGASSVKRD
jgi:Putative auto-transporter adhesin, head GIN domain